MIIRNRANELEQQGQVHGFTRFHRLKATAGLATVHSFGGGVLGPSLRTRQMATLPDE